MNKNACFATFFAHFATFFAHFATFFAHFATFFLILGIKMPPSGETGASSIRDTYRREPKRPDKT